MSISYVVPVWREDVYANVAYPWIKQQLDEYGGELIEVRGSSSIFDALECGRKTARNRFIMYVHDDVQLLSQIDLDKEVSQAFKRFSKLGLLGPVGKVQRLRVPWWLNAGKYVGHWYRRGEHDQLVYQYTNARGRVPFRDVDGDPVRDWARRSDRWDQFAKAGLVDGFYLIEDSNRFNEPWDTDTYGEQWHGYDVDRCYHAHQLGLDVMVSPWLFLHDNGGHAGYKGSNPDKIRAVDQEDRRVNSEGDALWLADLDHTNQLVRSKWGVA